MYFRFLIDEATGCVSYLLADCSRREAIVIDPRHADVAVLHGMLNEQQLRLKWVLQTHSHANDASLKKEDWTLHGVQFIDASVASDLPSTLTFGAEKLLLLTTPGHTVSCVSYLWRDRLYCGGLLTGNACPHQPSPANPAKLWDSVTRKVFTLPNETLLFFGHSRMGRVVSTVHEQRSTHPWFGGASRDEFLSRFTPSSGVKPIQSFQSVKYPELSNAP